MFAASVKKEEHANDKGYRREQQIPHTHLDNEIQCNGANQNRKLRNYRPSREQSENDHDAAHDVSSRHVVKSEHAAVEITELGNHIGHGLAVLDEKHAGNEQKHSQGNA